MASCVEKIRIALFEGDRLSSYMSVRNSEHKSDREKVCRYHCVSIEILPELSNAIA